MPPPLALFLTVVFVVVLFVRDVRARPNVSWALLLPLCWLLITGSRFVGQWVAVFTGGAMGAANVSLEDGSPIDRLVFLGLILGGLYILGRRRVRVWQIATSNAWLTIFLVYCFLAILWSDLPFVAFKRWVKILSHPIMALVVITEPDPRQALRTLLKRTAYVLVPASIMLIKYFPEIGRGFNSWTGEGYNRGASPSKNELGYVCMMLGLFFIWNALTALRMETGRARRHELLLSGGFLFMIWWLLSVAQSMTSLACALVGGAVMAALQTPLVVKRYVGWYVMAGVVLLGVGEQVFGLYEQALAALGRDATLTDRTGVWADVIALTPNAVLGAGFESFWLGERLDTMYAKWWWRPSQAHSGYVETYINLGWLGIGLLAATIVAAFRTIRFELLRDFEFGQLGMGYLAVIVIYNVTEATFKSVHPLWTIFYIVALSYPARAVPHPEDSAVGRPAMAERGRAVARGARGGVPRAAGTLMIPTARWRR